MTERDARPTIAAPDDDPHLWLEAIEGPEALAWTAGQTAATLQRYGGVAFERDRNTLTAILDRPDKIPLVTRFGAHVYNIWKDARHPRGLWRRTTLASYAEPEPAWEVLLDLDALALAEGEDWIWAGTVVEPGGNPGRAVLRLSRGGSDAAVHREFDLAEQRFADEGFVLPEAKGSVVWLDRDTVLMASSLGEGMATRAGYARTVRLWSRGTDPMAAPVLFETSADSMSVWAEVDRTGGGERLWFLDKPAFFDTIGWTGDRDGPRERVDLPLDAWWNVFGDWLAVKPRKDWTVGSDMHPADTLLGASLSAFIGGERRFTTLFEPDERRTLKSFFWNAGRLVLSIMDDLEPSFEIAIPGAQAWERHGIGTLPKKSVVSLWSLDAEDSASNGEVFVAVQDPVTPPELLLLDIAGSPAELGAPALLKRSPAAFDASGLVVTRQNAISVDGVAIPYVQVGPADLTGEAPVHMTGYGGFGVTVEPNYGSAVGKLWLERGGTSVIANIRGGGEFGSRWHDAGRREGKRLSHDDFAAVARDLVERGVTRPQRIAAEGGSNGGLLIANMLTRYPDRFGALFCTIPLIDMRRYSKLLAGASWIDEYGDPDLPADWDFLREISAYHRAEAERPYPPILLATTRRDDRVHPGHARKMAAKLQALGHAAHFYEPETGGHGYGKDNRERASFVALGYAFLRDAIDWKAG